MTDSSALHVDFLTKVYQESGGSPAGGVRDASFDLPEGTFFTLLGPSGCGKTTTLRCIAGLEFPDRGSIRVGDRTFYNSSDGTWVPMNLRKIGMVFQSYAIWPHMTVFENVAFPLRVAKDERFSRRDIEAMVNEALRTVSLDGFGGRPATRLSGGQQQRVALARAIVRKPRLLLLDEPLSNLDATLREEMRNELKRLQRQIGVTTVYVTHDQTEALEMSDTIAIINEGRIVQMGSPREIYFSPQDSFVASFVGSTNLVRGRLIGTSGGDAISVEIGGGQTIACSPRSHCSNSGPISVSVRPETIRLSAPGGPGGGTCNRVEGEVVMSGFVGNMNRYHIRVGDTVFQAGAEATADYPVGTRVAMDFPIETTLAFPSASSDPRSTPQT
ncbi:ABC transporter ATP-binding protein [Chelativorans sp. AA-79]|uniref:ABC transporter ATP-binding protein n=1 Tax=Chelativorans sp. AA-79 TaxID=3028735 RepID=UPI0023FA188D|nr:ABC transporter ATP-binding protein [Chelativorans sp. AA-79]WEX08724.1 ABC transporter ATP-binding protein [Chelativorans sp. AA-79]